MKLEINKSHKKIDQSSLKKTLRNITIGTLAIIDVFSGAVAEDIINDADNTYFNLPNNAVVYADTLEDEVYIPDEYREMIINKTDKQDDQSIITKDDLNKITDLYLFVNNSETSLEFLQYSNNLKSLIIVTDADYTSSEMDFLQTLSNQNLNHVDIFDKGSTLIRSEDLKSIFDKCPNLEELYLNNIILDAGTEEELNKLKTLSLGGQLFEKCDIDFSRLKNIENLDVSDMPPLTLAVFFNDKEYNSLINSGINVKFQDEESKNLYLEACDKINNIIDSLPIDENSSDKEKLDAILIYVLENLKYDEDVSNAIANGGDYKELSKKFYQYGLLTGALYKDSCICGNIASLVEACFDRVSLPTSSYYATSNDHAWNIVIVDGEAYTVDATWLESSSIIKEETEEEETEHGFSITYTQKEIDPVTAIKKGKGEELDWYLEELDVSDLDKDGHHDLSNPIPEYMLNGTEINNDNKKQKDISKKLFKFKVGKKEYIIAGAVLIGILSSLGIAIRINQTKKEQERKRRIEQERRKSQYNYEYNKPNSIYGSSPKGYHSGTDYHTGHGRRY